MSTTLWLDGAFTLSAKVVRKFVIQRMATKKSRGKGKITRPSPSMGYASAIAAS
jgi:hypothetical protein